MSALLEVLGRVPLFAGLEPAELAELARHGADRKFAKGQLIFAEGEEGAGFHTVLEGRVKVYKTGADGRQQILHLWGPGEIFGEVPVFAGGAYPASAEAMEISRTFYLPRRALRDRLAAQPELALKLLAALSRRLHHFAGLIEDLSLKQVPGRLAAHLLELHPVERGAQPLVELTLSRGELAALLGTIPETLSRILARLAREGLVDSLSPRRLRLLDPQALAELADGSRRLS